MRVLVTGATGFIGPVLCELLAARDALVRAAVRSPRAVPAGATEVAVVGDIGSRTDWTDALQNVDHVVHLAARAHVMSDGPEQAALYFETNLRGTERLATQAAEHGVRRFVNLSSIKAAVASRSEEVGDPYGESKLLAERALHDLGARTKMEVASVRSPLVYGPGVRANFLRLMTWIDRERWLPFGSVHNRRSLVSVWNLCDLLVHVLHHPAAAGHAWMVSDCEDLSTPELIGRIAHAMGRRARLLSVPPSLLYLGGTVIGKRAEIARLCGSLVADVRETRDRLAWSPPATIQNALARTVRWYLGRNAEHES